MSDEQIEIWSADPLEQSRKISDGQLIVGQHGLPVLLFADDLPPLDVWSLPAAWRVRHRVGTIGPLLEAWHMIEEAREICVNAKREAETEAGADDRDRAQQRATDNRIAMEVDERREYP